MPKHKNVLIAFNGPPSSGKTHFFTRNTNEFLKEHSKQSIAFSDCLYEAVMALYSIDRSVLRDIESSGVKNEPLQMFFGKSLREVLIGMSEDYLKKFHNDRTVFSRLLANKVRNQPLTDKHHVDILDTGFHDEFGGYLAELAPRFYDHIILIRIHREGCSFEGDSRHYITEEHVKAINELQTMRAGTQVHDFDIQNIPFTKGIDVLKDEDNDRVLSELQAIVTSPFAFE